MNGLRFIRARQSDLSLINTLIERSKSYWQWPDGYLEKSLPLLRISPAYLEDNYCVEGSDANNSLVTFFSVKFANGKRLLDHLWVTPELIGKGIGTAACAFLVRLAQNEGWTELWVLPDPPAEGFYKKQGFIDTGERIPSRIPDGPIFSVLCLSILPSSD